MSEPEEEKTFLELEGELSRFYQGAVPEPGFASRLETQMVAKASSMQAAASSQPHNIFYTLLRRPLLSGALAVLLALVIAVAIIGPQKVLAEMQRLFGYLPGYGFVQSDQVLVLAEPVVVQKEGAVLRVVSVVAESRQTTITFNVTGLSPKIFNAPGSDGPSPVLVFADGTQWTINEMETKTNSRGEMSISIHYPPLPTGIDRFMLFMRYLPGVSAGYAPENWSIPLALSISKSISPYMPPGASTSDQGITVSVLQVAQSATELGLQVQFSWKNPTWKSLQGPAGMLKDENGHPIPLADLTGVGSNEANFTTSAPGLFISPYRYSLPTVPVKKYTLTFDQMWVVAQSDASFTFDPGSNPQPGQTWDLSGSPGMDLKIEGVQVKILSASYEGRVTSYEMLPPGSEIPTPVYGYRLAFQVKTTPFEGISVRSLEFDLAEKPVGGSSSEGTLEGVQKVSINLREPPAHSLTFNVYEAMLIIQGTWQIDWTPPQGNTGP